MEIKFVEWPSEKELESLWSVPVTSSCISKIKVCGAVMEDGSGVIVYGDVDSDHHKLLANALKRELGITLRFREAPGVVKVGGGKFTFGITGRKHRKVWAQDQGGRSDTLGGGMPKELDQPAEDYIKRRVGALLQR